MVVWPLAEHPVPGWVVPHCQGCNPALPRRGVSLVQVLTDGHVVEPVLFDGHASGIAAWCSCFQVGVVAVLACDAQILAVAATDVVVVSDSAAAAVVATSGLGVAVASVGCE